MPQLADVVLLPSHLLGRGGGRGQAPRHQSPTYQLGSPGRCPEQPTLTICIFDNSGSITSGNDPVGNRYVEAAYALERVSRRCRCDRELAAVLHFDTPTSGDVPPTSIGRQGLGALRAGLAAPPDGAGRSTLTASLRAAEQIAARHALHQVSLLVFSDFELFDADVPLVLAELSAFPGVVHAVVLRARPPARLLDDPRGTVTPISYNAEPGVVARALFDGLTTHRPRRQLVTPARRR